MGRLFSKRPPIFIVLLPMLFLIILYNSYQVPLVLSIKFAIVLFYGYLYCNARTLTRLILLAAFPILYWILGGWFSLFFVVLVLCIHLVSRWSIFTLLFPVLFAALYVLSAYFSARFIFQVTAFRFFIFDKFHQSKFVGSRRTRSWRKM